jgi:hypothetical protein
MPDSQGGAEAEGIEAADIFPEGEVSSESSAGASTPDSPGDVEAGDIEAAESAPEGGVSSESGAAPSRVLTWEETRHMTPEEYGEYVGGLSVEEQGDHFNTYPDEYHSQAPDSADIPGESDLGPDIDNEELSADIIDEESDSATDGL